MFLWGSLSLASPKSRAEAAKLPEASALSLKKERASPTNNKTRVEATQEMQGARYQWLTLVILVTWEAEIWRIEVPGQPRQNNLRDPHLQNNQS
jgi:hypothetical protein